MKLKFSHLSLVILLCVSSSVAEVEPPIVRTWTSSDGKQLEAQYVSKTDKAVVVKRKVDGKQLTLPLDRLSPEDIAWVQALPAPAPAGAKPAVPPAATGPVNPVSKEYAPLLTGDWALAKFKNLPYAFYADKSLPTTSNAPLVVMLHGKSSNDENGKQVSDWMKTFAKPERFAKHPCYLLAPLCYQPFGGTGGGWNDKPGTECIALVKDLLKSLPIDKNKVYVCGHSMGGFGTCYFLATESRMFAAGIPVAGCTNDSGPLKRTPLWVFHAADDDVVKVDGARTLAKALDNAKSFKYTEYPTGGHGITTKVFDDDAVIDWLFKQTR
jgi:dienelactone hydrolase